MLLLYIVAVVYNIEEEEEEQNLSMKYIVYYIRHEGTNTTKTPT